MATSAGDVTQEAPWAGALQPHLWPQAPVTPPPTTQHQHTHITQVN